MVVTATSKALDLYLATSAVVGQEPARQQMAALLDRQWQVHRGDFPGSSGAILSGVSGSGKTMLSKLMCSHLGLPFAEVDATRYTEQGYKGLDLQQMFIPLLEAAAEMKDAEHPLEASRFSLHESPEPVIRFGNDNTLRLDQQTAGANRESSVLKRDDIEAVVERAQTGVVLLDEFDKWMLRINHVTGEKDKAIQSELLKMVEGSTEYVSSSDEDWGVKFDTSRVLIICAGAFVGLFQQVAKRLHADADDKSYMLQENFWNQITQEDFERFGLLPELAGRLARHIFTRPLRREHLRAILAAPDGLLAEYRRRYESYGCRWAVKEAGEIKLADLASQRQTGARALDHVVDKMLGGEALFKAATAEQAVEVVFEPHMAKAEVRAI